MTSRQRHHRLNAWSPLRLFAAMSLILAGCAATPTTRFHTLLPAPPATAERATYAAPILTWELLPVTVPMQVDQPQLVVRLPDDTLAVLEHDRWIAPLSDEIRAALLQHIESDSAANPAAMTGAPPLGQPWRIAVDVQRFDSAVGRYARVEAEWSIRPAQGSVTTLRCRSVFEQPVSAGMPALAAGHRAAMAQLGKTLAAALKAVANGGSPGCAALVAP
jgi:uncharacterized lipoprotein YmbA